MKKCILSLLMAIVMLISLVPVNAFAVDGESTITEGTEESVNEEATDPEASDLEAPDSESVIEEAVEEADSSIYVYGTLNGVSVEKGTEGFAMTKEAEDRYCVTLTLRCGDVVYAAGKTDEAALAALEIGEMLSAEGEEVTLEPVTEGKAVLGAVKKAPHIRTERRMNRRSVFCAEKSRSQDDNGFILWYNLTAMKNNTEVNYTPYQLRLPIEISKIIDVDDPVLSFREVMDHIDLSKYFADRKVSRTGRPRCDSEKLLMVVLFAFMDEGFESLRGLAKRCRNDIRYMWLLDGMEAPSFMTFSNFIRHELSASIEDIFIEDIFKDINGYIFAKEGVDTEHVYIDGTKIEANANKYSWVWKKSCLTNRDKVFGYITELLGQINEEELFYYDLKMEPREEYAIEYVEHLMKRFLEITGKSEADFVKGQGHKKSIEQKQYEKLKEYLNRLKKYAEQIEICGESRNSYAKADHGATFMRIKRDYMGNDQLLPAYNMQLGVCDEYVAVVRVEQYASDDEAVRGNKYGRTEELYVCENCAGCTLREKCFKGKGNRVVRLNRELTSIHEEVMANLECTHGMLLMMNRCIQSEGTFGSIKWNRWYKRALRRGIDSVKLEFMLIACGFNLYKYHNKKIKALKGAA